MGNEKRIKKVTIRLTEKEYEKLNKKLPQRNSLQLSQYIRNILFERPVLVKYRNESMDVAMEELIQLKQELNAVGNNVNQAVKKLHTLRQIAEFRQWIAANENIQQELTCTTDRVYQWISQLSDKWLQE